MNLQEEQLKKDLQKYINLARREIVEIKNYFDDKDKLNKYLYYLHGIFSNLEITLIKLERLEKENVDTSRNKK